MHQASRLTVGQKLGFGCGDVAINIALMSSGLFLTYFYTDIFGIRAEHVGLVFLLIRVVDAFADLGMGWFMDRIPTPRAGRYRHWLGMGALPFGLSLYLVFAGPELGYGGRLAWAGLTYAANSLLYTLVTIPYIALIGTISTDPQQRLSANTYRFVMAKLAVLAVTSSLALLADGLGQGDKARGFALAMGLMGALGSLALWICYRSTREVVQHPPLRMPLPAQLRLLWGNSQWRVLAGACVLMMTGYVVRGSIAVHYAVYLLRLDPASAAFALFMGLWALGGIAAALLSRWLCLRWCKVRVFRHSLWIAALWGGLMYLAVPPGGVLVGMAFYFGYCLLSELNTPIFWAAIADVVEHGERQSGHRVGGLIFGSICFFQKLAMGLAGFIVGGLLAWVGYVPQGPQNSTALDGIALMLTLIPALFFLLTAGVMRWYVLTDTLSTP